jgi:hypothetical protein
MGISPYASAADFLVLLSGQPLPVSENVSAHIRLANAAKRPESTDPKQDRSLLIVPAGTRSAAIN